MADAIGPANISHNSGQLIIRVFFASSAGIGGELLRQQRAPGAVLPFAASRGSHKPLVLPKSLKSIRRKRSVSSGRLQIAMTQIVRQLGGNLLSHSLSRNAVRHLAVRRI